MTNNMPLVSVYIPCYNVEQYVEKCVRSVMAQTYENLDILLINNNSTDGTAEILESLKGEDSRIRLFFNEGEGVSDARNMAAGLCLGEWIVEADSDDALIPEAVEILYYLATENDCNFACGSYYLCGTDGFTKDKPIKMKPFISKDKQEIHRYFLTDGRNFNQTWGKIYKKELLEKIVYPTGKLYEDLAVMPEIIEACDGCVVSEIPVYYYAIRPGSISTGAILSRQMDGLDLRLANCVFYEKKYPEILPLAFDCVLEFAFFMMGKIKNAGINNCKDVWEKCVGTVKSVSKKAEKKGLAMKLGVLVTRLSPKLAATLFSMYSKKKNNTV